MSEEENLLENKKIGFDYISYRLDKQIDWYDQKSIKYKRWYVWLKTLEIISAALIPLLSDFKYVGGSLGYQEN